MRNLAWLEALSIELRRQRLPADYSARLMDELADHLVDVMEDAMSTGIARDVDAVSRRMGAPRDVAQTAATEFRRRGFFGRHPLLTFVTLPIVTALFVWVLAPLCIVGMTGVWQFSVRHGWAEPELSPFGAGALKFVCKTVMILPVMVAAWVFVRVAVRNGLNWRWPLAACAILGLFITFAGIDSSWSMLPGKSNVMLSLGAAWGPKSFFYQLARFAAPMSVGIWILSRATRREPTAMAS